MIHTLLTSPIGTLAIGVEGHRIRFVTLVDANDAHANKFIQQSRQVFAEEQPQLMQAVRQLTEYFKGKRKEFSLPIHYRGTAFQKKVWDQLLRIPYGQTKSYGQLAASLGGKNKARAVGGAAHNNPLLILIPCHRLIGSDGSLTGFGAGIDAKQKLLALEGWKPLPQGQSNSNQEALEEEPQKE
ncbi:methylated-DNA--[protein]-cysteine S-methyltransferase [Desulfogranum japonicum]|uniref:methylated-DNA--[protein]-cysteine S-methyltransferase n=1 Tax=Desulfogranum japonicum TaxID=231447 RepID=UPI00041D67B5|nr:methylated-DNA--[protein]-cysteine S-methyltransferase [Desulfogranum japonicum]